MFCYAPGHPVLDALGVDLSPCWLLYNDIGSRPLAATPMYQVSIDVKPLLEHNHLQCDPNNGCVGNVFVFQERGLQLGGSHLQSVHFNQFLPRALVHVPQSRRKYL